MEDLKWSAVDEYGGITLDAALDYGDLKELEDEDGYSDTAERLCDEATERIGDEATLEYAEVEGDRIELSFMLA